MGLGEKEEVWGGGSPPSISENFVPRAMPPSPPPGTCHTTLLLGLPALYRGILEDLEIEVLECGIWGGNSVEM